MNQLPATPNPGSPPAPAVWFRQAIDYMRALTARVAALEGRGAGAVSRAARGVNPFALTGFIDTGPTAKIRIAPGMVNNFVPTIGGTSLVAVPPPAITVTGASGIIQLKATVDGAGAITALIAEGVAGPAVTADTATEKYKLVGTWTASGGAFTSVVSILNVNQAFYLCNGTAIWD
jgi:hypothetical protein